MPPQPAGLRTLSAKAAAALDAELMNPTHGAFSLDQLMELAGLSVSQALYKLHPPTPGKSRILIAVGPGNNGGDGLVAARHLFNFGYECTVYYPKRPKNELFQRLTRQLQNLHMAFTDDFDTHLSHNKPNYIIDSIFGFSFSGPIRDPFPSVITALSTTKIPILAVDAPSSWDIESGPPEQGPGKDYMPTALISLTAPKPLVKWFGGRHFVGGRFLHRDVAQRYALDVPDYEGVEQVVEVSNSV